MPTRPRNLTDARAWADLLHEIGHYTHDYDGKAEPMAKTIHVRKAAMDEITVAAWALRARDRTLTDAAAIAAVALDKKYQPIAAAYGRATGRGADREIEGSVEKQTRPHPYSTAKEKAWQAIDLKVTELLNTRMRGGPFITREQALAEVLDENPGLYEAWRNARD